MFQYLLRKFFLLMQPPSLGRQIGGAKVSHSPKNFYKLSQKKNAYTTVYAPFMLHKTTLVRFRWRRLSFLPLTIPSRSVFYKNATSILVQKFLKIKVSQVISFFFHGCKHFFTVIPSRIIYRFQEFFYERKHLIYFVV